MKKILVQLAFKRNSDFGTLPDPFLISTMYFKKNHTKDRLKIGTKCSLLMAPIGEFKTYLTSKFRLGHLYIGINPKGWYFQKTRQIRFLLFWGFFF